MIIISANSSIASPVTVTSDEVTTFVIDNDKEVTDYYTGTTIPVSKILTVTSGNSTNTTNINYSSDISSAIFSIDVSHGIDNTGAFNETNADIANTHDTYLSFIANTDTTYSISGFYNMTGEARTYLYVYLVDNNATPYTNPMLLQEKSESLSTKDESFALDGVAEGDHYNLLYGSLNGNLIAGHNYSLFIDAYIQARGINYVITEAVANATGNVTLTIGEPVSSNDLICAGVSFVVDKNTVLSIDVNNDLLSNCENYATGSTVTLEGTTKPKVAGSTLSFDGGNTLTYTPETDYVGNDSFKYKATNGFVIDTRIVAIQVKDGATPVPDNDLVCADVSFDVEKNTVLTIDIAADLLAKCVEPGANSVISLISTTQPSIPGSILSYDGGNTLIYTPADDFEGDDIFTYTVTDGTVTDARTVTLNISTTGSNDTSVSNGSSGVINPYYLITLFGLILMLQHYGYSRHEKR